MQRNPFIMEGTYIYICWTWYNVCLLT